jgi:hypothetical protein
MFLGIFSTGALPPGSPLGASVKREAPLPKPFLTCLSVPSKETPSRFPLRSPYTEKDVPFPEPSFTYLYKSSAKELPFQVPLAELSRALVVIIIIIIIIIIINT